MVTSSLTYGGKFSETDHLQGIEAWVWGGDDPTEEKDRQVALLWEAFQKEVDEALPERVWWRPSTSEFVYDVAVGGVPGKEEMSELFDAAWERVAARYEQVVAQQP